MSGNGVLKRTLIAAFVGVSLAVARAQCLPDDPTSSCAQARTTRTPTLSASDQRRALFEKAMAGKNFADLGQYTMYFKNVADIPLNQSISESDMRYYTYFMPPNIKAAYAPVLDLETRVREANKKLFVDKGGGTEDDWKLAMAPDVVDEKPSVLDTLKDRFKTAAPPPAEAPKPGTEDYCREALNWLTMNSPNATFDALKAQSSLRAGAIVMYKRRPDCTRIAALAKDQSGVEAMKQKGFIVWDPPLPNAQVEQKPVAGNTARDQKLAREKVRKFQSKNGKYIILPNGEAIYMMPSMLTAWWPYSFDIKYVFSGLGLLLLFMIVTRIILTVRRIAANTSK